MYINFQALEKLPVFTESGQKLGHVHDLELDVETHGIRHYIVEHGIIGKDHYLVAPIQVKSITAEKMIVADTILSDPSFKLDKKESTGKAKPALGGVTPRTEVK